MSLYISYLLNVLVTYGILFLLFRVARRTKLLLLPLALLIPALSGVLNLYFGLWQPFSTVYGTLSSWLGDMGLDRVKHFWPMMEGIAFTSFLWLIYDTVQGKRYHSG
jgi:hypothetical protein